MLYTHAALVRQFNRFLERLPSSLVHDVARLLPERIDKAYEAAFQAEGWRWSELPWNAIAAAPGHEHVLALRGFFLCSGFWTDPTRGVLGTDEDPKFWRDGEKMPADTPKFQQLSLGRCFFLDRQKRLWEIRGTFKSGNLELSGKECTAADLVNALPPNMGGPMEWCRKLMLVQIGPMAKEARERASRLERLTQYIDEAVQVDPDIWAEQEYVVASEGNPPRATRVRDIQLHPVRNTFLVSEWEVGQPPHMVVEFKTILEAIAKIGDVPGQARGRLQEGRV